MAHLKYKIILSESNVFQFSDLRSDVNNGLERTYNSSADVVSERHCR